MGPKKSSCGSALGSLMKVKGAEVACTLPAGHVHQMHQDEVAGYEWQSPRPGVIEYLRPINQDS